MVSKFRLKSTSQIENDWTLACGLLVGESYFTSISGLIDISRGDSSTCRVGLPSKSLFSMAGGSQQTAAPITLKASNGRILGGGNDEFTCDENSPNFRYVTNRDFGFYEVSQP